MSDTAGWLASQGIGGPVAWEDVGLLARRQAEEAEHRAEAAEAERKAQMEEAHDQRMTAYYMNGVTAGSVLQRALQMSELDGEIAEHQAAITKLERRRSRLRQEGDDQAEAVSRSYTMAQRSAPSPSGLGDVAERDAEIRQALASRARVEARLAQRPRSQPTATLTARSASRSVSLPKAGGGAAVAEVHPAGKPCICRVPGCDAYPPDPAVGAERRAGDLVALGYSRQMAHLAQHEVTRYGGPVVSVR